MKWVLSCEVRYLVIEDLFDVVGFDMNMIYGKFLFELGMLLEFLFIFLVGLMVEGRFWCNVFVVFSDLIIDEYVSRKFVVDNWVIRRFVGSG